MASAQPIPTSADGRSGGRPRLGYCDFGCNACGQACPSYAVPELPLEQKRLEVIGVAAIDRKRCLPWAEDTPCIVCQEMCPTPQKVIKLTKGETVERGGGVADWVRRPVMLPERCIGCGICEHKCPVNGRSAIVVRPAGQARLDPQVYSPA